MDEPRYTMEIIAYLKQSIDFQNSEAIFLQIEMGILQAIVNKRLTPGAQTPSTKVLALQLGINPNTVHKAYRELQLKGILESRKGKRLTIHDSALERSREAIAVQLIAKLYIRVGEARLAGMKSEEILAIVKANL